MGIIQLICGEINHRAFWAYVSMYPSKYVEYCQKVADHEDVNVEEYGIVIDKGWGALPPQEAQDRMKADFDTDNAFEEQLMEAGEKMLVALEEAEEQAAKNNIH